MNKITDEHKASRSDDKAISVCENLKFQYYKNAFKSTKLNKHL